MCRDWHFTGEQGTWDKIRDYTHWKKEDINRWKNEDWKLFVKRDDATCHGHHSIFVGLGEHFIDIHADFYAIDCLYVCERH